jgi:hypothetical protein
MRRFHVNSVRCRLAAILVFCSTLAHAGNTPPPRISQHTREEIVHAFNAELVYIRTNFPMGKTGLKLKNGTITPAGAELQRLMDLWGPAAKPGDLARISNVVIKEDHIRFEINGGPIKKQKWYQHIEISGANGGGTIAPSDPNANAHGSFVELYFDKYVPETTGPELKKLLRPVFDFDSKSGLEAFLETVSPKVKEAIKNHHVLVGMNHEMVIYAKGRPPKKVREHEGGVQSEVQSGVKGEVQNGEAPEAVEYEEWIYGAPPEDVDFVRFVGDEVVRVETMKVDGQKIVRVEREVEMGKAAVAKKQEDRPVTAPTLRRPGEEMPESNPANPASVPPMAPPPPPAGTDPGPN